MPWEWKHSVVADAPRKTVWEFVSQIDNLARVEGDAVESMTLDGPFQAGTKGSVGALASNRQGHPARGIEPLLRCGLLTA
jgi:hypothetical protein